MQPAHRNLILDTFPEMKDVFLADECPVNHEDMFTMFGAPRWIANKLLGQAHFEFEYPSLKLIPDSPTNKIVCIKSEEFLFTPSGAPSEVLWHEYGHVISEPETENDLRHFEKFKAAVVKLGHPWLARDDIPLTWLAIPPTMEQWNNRDSDPLVKMIFDM